MCAENVVAELEGLVRGISTTGADRVVLAVRPDHAVERFPKRIRKCLLRAIVPFTFFQADTTLLALFSPRSTRRTS
jgi:hypothetical protein